MMQSLNRRNFLRMGVALPVASAVLPSITRSAFAAPAAAAGFPWAALSIRRRTSPCLASMNIRLARPLPLSQ